MGTVTYIPATNGFFLTSNRDVRFDRDLALATLVQKKPRPCSIGHHQRGPTCTVLPGIEPRWYRAVYPDNAHIGKLYKCRWDGENKWVSTINSRVAHFWSSATLYDKMAAGKRRNWFELWRRFGAQITIRSIMHFHRYGGYGDPKDSLVMDRQGTVKTVSITNIHVQPQQMTMTYHDLMGDRQYTSELQVTRGPGYPLGHMAR